MLLPDGYTQLQYLESSGTQYINTSFTPNTSKDKLVFDVEYVGANEYFAGTQSGAIYYGVRQGNSADTMAWHCLNSGSAITFDCHFVGDRHTFTYDHNALYVDNTLKALGNYQGSVGVALYLFARNNANTATNFCSCKIYSAEFYRDGELIHSYIPAERNSDGVLGLYDTVARVFRTNSGSGTFLAGPVAVETDENELIIPQYDIEIWDWKTNTYVADISNIVTDGVNFSWILNDVETIDFSIDLVQFEKKCTAMGVTPEQVLTPYVHDIRVRRNGHYIVGAQVVETNFKIENDSAVIEIKCTGFLNLFKDQYISESWGGYTYAQIARKLVERGQHADCLIKNPTIDIDSGYWLTDNGSLSRVTTSTHGGSGKLQVTRSGTGWNTCGTKMDVPINTPCKIDIWVAGQSGVAISVVERSLINSSTNQQTIASVTPTAHNTWTHITGTFTTRFEDGYLYIQQNRTNASYNLWVDDCYVYRADDDDSLNNLNVSLGTDTASMYQTANRERNYALQNIKDALIDLTSLEDDNFDFAFSADRTFNCYYQKGDFRPEVELVYPQNIDSMTITRSASNMANKIIGIGSGIGDERLQVYATDTSSRQMYGTRESILTNNNVSLENTLIAQAEGELRDRKNPVNLPSVVICDGSVNPSNTEVGDILLVKVLNDEYLGTINGYYRIMQYDLSLSPENIETVTLTLELVGGL